MSNARDRNHLNLHPGVFPLLKVVDHGIADVFIVTIPDKTVMGTSYNYCLSYSVCDSAEFCEVVLVGLDGNTWLMIPAVKGGILFVSLVTEFGGMCVW